MKVSTDLFDLIKTLKKGEKRYFSLYNKQQGVKNKYVRLFDAIDKQAKYDEQKLKKQFAKESVIKNFSITKNYLYHNLLKSLEAYDKDKSVERTIMHQLSQSKVLAKKGLFRQSQKLLTKTKKEAYKYEYFYLLLSVFDQEINILVNYETEDLPDKLDKVLEEREAALNILQQDELLLRLKCKIYAFAKRGMRTRNEEQVEELQAIIGHPMLSSIDNAKTFSSKLHYYSVLSIYNLLQRNFEEAYQLCLEAVKIWDDYPHFKESKKETYLACVNNLLIRSRYQRYFDENLHYIDILKKIDTGNNIALEQKKFLVVYSNELAYWMYVSDTERGLALVPEIEKGLKKYGKNISQEWFLVFQTGITNLFFAKGMFEQALDWINLLLNSKEIGVRKDIYATARMVRLIILFELDHTMLIEHMSQSTVRYLKKTDHYYQLEAALIRFLKRAIDAPNTEQLRQEHVEFYITLVGLTEDNLQLATIDYFDFFAWLHRKLRGCTDPRYWEARRKVFAIAGLEDDEDIEEQKESI